MSPLPNTLHSGVGERWLVSSASAEGDRPPKCNKKTEHGGYDDSQNCHWT